MHLEGDIQIQVMGAAHDALHGEAGEVGHIACAVLAVDFPQRFVLRLGEAKADHPVPTILFRHLIFGHPPERSGFVLYLGRSLGLRPSISAAVPFSWESVKSIARARVWLCRCIPVYDGV